MIETYKINYDEVIRKLDNSFHPICGVSCLYKSILIGGELLRPPRLVRTCHTNCSVCKKKSVAFYDFEACNECATETGYPKEFSYYHEICRLRS